MFKVTDGIRESDITLTLEVLADQTVATVSTTGVVANTTEDDDSDSATVNSSVDYVSDDLYTTQPDIV